MKNKTVDGLIIFLSIIVAILVSILARYTFDGADSVPWDVHKQPRLHAILNSITALCIIAGFIVIKQKKVKLHRFFMFGAFSASALFLVSYVLYHGLTDSTNFGGQGLVKYIYFVILISHIILATLIFPIILITIHRAITNQLDAHKRWAKITFPIWLYVAITGVVVYFMISPYYGS